MDIQEKWTHKIVRLHTKDDMAPVADFLIGRLCRRWEGCSYNLVVEGQDTLAGADERFKKNLKQGKYLNFYPDPILAEIFPEPPAVDINQPACDAAWDDYLDQMDGGFEPQESEQSHRLAFMAGWEAAKRA